MSSQRECTVSLWNFRMSANSWLLDRFLSASALRWNSIAFADFPRRRLLCSSASFTSVIIWTSFNARSLMSFLASCSISLTSPRARALANISGMASLFRSFPVRGKISLVTRLACTVFARLKSERFAIFGHARQTDGQRQFCVARRSLVFFCFANVLTGAAVFRHARALARRGRLNLAAAVQNAKVIGATSTTDPLERFKSDCQCIEHRTGVPFARGREMDFCTVRFGKPFWLDQNSKEWSK